MGHQFYRILADNASYADRWFLGSPLGADGQEIDARLFTYGTNYSGELPAEVVVARAGRLANFNFADFDMPVVSQSVAMILSTVCPDDVQLLPVCVKGMPEGAYILNVTTRCKCIDERRTEILRWFVSDGRPDKIGQYRMVTNLRIDPEKVKNHHMFRIVGWEVAVIVSEYVLHNIEQVMPLGIRADAVSK